MSMFNTRPRAPVVEPRSAPRGATIAESSMAPADVEHGIRDLLARTDRNTSLTVGKIQTVGHLRRTARDIAANLFGIHTETAEVVALQNAFENAMNAFCKGASTPSEALEYVAPDAARAQQVAQSLAARATAAPAPEMAADHAVLGEDTEAPATQVPAVQAPATETTSS